MKLFAAILFVLAVLTCAPQAHSQCASGICRRPVARLFEKQVQASESGERWIEAKPVRTAGIYVGERIRRILPRNR